MERTCKYWLSFEISMDISLLVTICSHDCVYFSFIRHHGELTGSHRTKLHVKLATPFNRHMKYLAHPSFLSTDQTGWRPAWTHRRNHQAFRSQGLQASCDEVGPTIKGTHGDPLSGFEGKEILSRLDCVHDEWTCRSYGLEWQERRC